MMNRKRRSSRLSDAISDDDVQLKDGEEFNLEEYIANINSVSQCVDWSPEELKALEQSDVTVAHKKRGNKMEVSFLDGLAKIRDKNGEQKWKKMLELTFNPNWKVTKQPKYVPRAFIIVSEKKNNL